MRSLFRVHPQNQDERNVVFLTLEVFGTGILSAAQSFFSPLALRLGATNTEIGLLTSIPALIKILLSFPLGRFLQGRPNQRLWVLGSMAASRLGYLLLALIPLISLPWLTQGTLVVGALILLNLPALLLYLGMYPLLIRVISPERRATLFSNQSIIALVVTAIGVYLFGQWLDRAPFPLNYQAMIGLAVLLSLWSVYWWRKVQVPAESNPAEAPPARPGLRAQFRIFEDLHYNGDLGRVIFNQILQSIGLWAAPPLYILYLIKELGANEAWIGLQATVASLAALGGWSAARWLVRRWGEPLTLKRSSPLITLYPILLGLSTSLTPALLAAAVNSLLSPVYSLSHNNLLLRSFPAGRAHEGIAVYNTLASIGGFIAPLVGVWVAGQVGLRATLVGCGVLSLAGSLSFWLWPVRGEER